MDSTVFYEMIMVMFMDDIVQVSAVFTAFVTVVTLITLSVQHFNDMR